MEKNSLKTKSDAIPLVDVSDSETAVPLPLLVKLLNQYFYDDLFLQAEQLINFTEKMAKMGKIVLDKNSTITLDQHDEEIQQFLNSEEVQTIKADRQQYDYFFQDGLLTNGWKISFDEPTRSVKYKLEEGLS